MRFRVNPNRMELLRLRRRLNLASRGHKLLKDKQEELMRQFLNLVRQARQMREQLESALVEIQRSFLAALAVLLDYEVATILPPEVPVNLSFKEVNVMSVRVPQLEIVPGHALGGGSALLPYGDLEVAVRRLRELFPQLLQLGYCEKAIALLAEDLERTRRRVNALEYVLIPSLEETIKFITEKLSENERATLTRLMKIKDIVRKH